MRTKPQEEAVSELATETMLHGFLDPYMAERRAQRQEEIKHALCVGDFYFIGKFIVEACLAGMAYDAIKKVLRRAFGKRRRMSVYERGHTNHASRTISIGLQKIGSITMSEALQERLLKNAIDYLTRPDIKKRMKRIEPSAILPPPLPTKSRKRTSPTSPRNSQRTRRGAQRDQG